VSERLKQVRQEETRIMLLNQGERRRKTEEDQKRFDEVKEEEELTVQKLAEHKAIEKAREAVEKRRKAGNDKHSPATWATVKP
jgi:biotin synthase-related radical SAM superfamily protein